MEMHVEFCICPIPRFVYLVVQGKLVALRKVLDWMIANFMAVYAYGTHKGREVLALECCSQRTRHGLVIALVMLLMIDKVNDHHVRDAAYI